jgi:hypothetical protein
VVEEEGSGGLVGCSGGTVVSVVLILGYLYHVLWVDDHRRNHIDKYLKLYSFFGSIKDS